MYNAHEKSLDEFSKLVKENCVYQICLFFIAFNYNTKRFLNEFYKLFFSSFYLVAFPHQKLSGKCNQKLKIESVYKRVKNFLQNFPPCFLLVIHSFVRGVRSYFVSVIEYTYLMYYMKENSTCNSCN